MTICAECESGFHSQCPGANGCDCDCNYEQEYMSSQDDDFDDENIVDCCIRCGMPIPIEGFCCEAGCLEAFGEES